jgi:hypothetical protein
VSATGGSTTTVGQGMGWRSESMPGEVRGKGWPSVRGEERRLARTPVGSAGRFTETGRYLIITAYEVSDE